MTLERLPDTFRASREELIALRGRYANDELDVVYTLEMPADELTLRIPGRKPIVMQPIFHDGFVASYLGVLKVTRDASGAVTGFTSHTRGVREIRFAAVQAPAVDFAQIEHQLARAWVDSDRATIDRIIAPDWTTISITGRMLTRADVMAEFFRDGKSPIAKMTIDDVRVRLLGDVAVVTGRTTARAIGSDADVVLRFTDVFALRDGRWQIVASQGTRSTP